jgi:hypothetical protein
MLKKVISRRTLTSQFYFQLMQIKDDDLVSLAVAVGIGVVGPPP